jgi:uncharacterized membrane protein YdjX (TVP38/TMEM64 family)
METVETKNKKGGAGLIKLIILALIVIGIGVILRYTDVAGYVTLANLNLFRETFGAFAPILYVLIYAVGTIVAFPGTILTLSSGLLFGTILGTLVVLIGATLGATAAFLLARYAGRGTVERFVSGGQLAKFDKSVSGSGFSAVLFTRLVPLFPFNLINFAWGLTGVKLRDYILATAIGILPGSFVYVNLASAVRTVLENSPDGKLSSVKFGDLLNPNILLAFALLGLLSFAPLAIKAFRRKKDDSVKILEETAMK